jgi:hypothetical protein
MNLVKTLYHVTAVCLNVQPFTNPLYITSKWENWRVKKGAYFFLPF